MDDEINPLLTNWVDEEKEKSTSNNQKSSNSY